MAQGDMLHRCAGDGQGAVVQAVDAAQLDLAHAEGFGQLVDELLLGVEQLGGAVAPEGPGGRRVGEDTVGVCADVVDVVRTGAVDIGAPVDEEGVVAVGPGAGDLLALPGQDLAVPGRTGFVAKQERVALTGALDGFLTAVGPFDGAAGYAAEIRRPCGQHPQAVFLAAEGAADGLLDNPHPVDGNFQKIGDIAAGIVRGLAAAVDGDESVCRVAVSQRCFRFNIDVLRALGLILPL